MSVIVLFLVALFIMACAWAWREVKLIAEEEDEVE